ETIERSQDRADRREDRPGGVEGAKELNSTKARHLRARSETGGAGPDAALELCRESRCLARGISLPVDRSNCLPHLLPDVAGVVVPRDRRANGQGIPDSH